MNKTKPNGSIQSTSLSSSSAMVSQSSSRKFTFDESTITIGFVMVLLTMLIITFSMFKLAGSIASLSERLYYLEQVLTKYSTHCILPLENL